MKKLDKQKYRALHADEIAEKKAEARRAKVAELRTSDFGLAKIAAQNFYKAVWRALNNPLTQFRTAPLPGQNPELHGALDHEMAAEIAELIQ